MNLETVPKFLLFVAFCKSICPPIYQGVRGSEVDSGIQAIGTVVLEDGPRIGNQSEDRKNLREGLDNCYR